MALRKPTSDELRLISYLVDKASNMALPAEWSADLQVESMSDGGMGSLRLFPRGAVGDARIFGRAASECQFIDADSVVVIVTLNLDKFGDLYELDIWKTNFEKLIRIPEELGRAESV